MGDREILDCIHSLIADQRRLHDVRDRGSSHDPEHVGRLAEITASLDQMWELLRRRRALRTDGFDPDVVDLTQRLVHLQPALVIDARVG